MAIYKIFPEKDTFISKYRSTQNFGRDEILEISNETEITALNADVNRTLVQFPTSQITDVITNIISGSAYSASLRLFLANATLPIDYTIEAYPLSQSWDMGLGKSSDNPITTLGCTWISRTTTSNWASTGSSYINTPSSSQSFNYISDKDINMNVTSIVNSWASSSIPNNGFLLKLSSSIENSTTPLITKFFSMDTHTIYPPQLELKWDDSYYNTTLTQITTSDFNAVISNLQNTFSEGTTYTFTLRARDKFPARAFSTTSTYLVPKALPITTYWALKDVKTEEMVIDFDTNFTKISCDNVSNYFKIYMNGLEPERYYQILYKTILSNGEIVVVDDESNYFKVVR
jgi:hypothetical protein